MTYSQARIDAYAAVDKALEDLARVCDEENDNEPCMISGWSVVMSGLRIKDTDPDDIHADDIDSKYSGYFFAKRAQDPIMSLGMLTEGLRHLNALQENGCCCDEGE